jgi:hypothetical protein
MPDDDLQLRHDRPEQDAPSELVEAVWTWRTAGAANGQGTASCRRCCEPPNCHVNGCVMKAYVTNRGNWKSGWRASNVSHSYARPGRYAGTDGRPGANTRHDVRRWRECPASSRSAFRVRDTRQSQRQMPPDPTGCDMTDPMMGSCGPI